MDKVIHQTETVEGSLIFSTTISDNGDMSTVLLNEEGAPIDEDHILVGFESMHREAIKRLRDRMD